jgi:hypothetical protein
MPLGHPSSLWVHSASSHRTPSGLSSSCCRAASHSAGPAGCTRASRQCADVHPPRAAHCQWGWSLQVNAAASLSQDDLQVLLSISQRGCLDDSPFCGLLLSCFLAPTPRISLHLNPLYLSPYSGLGFGGEIRSFLLSGC